ncbi:hypothetical protein DV515_00009343 [Chloebia gouldiae]|uniref:EF-hand domain-containing protein n=1 Tax=Chloebia gouldiae TaxID=44316 RepID=A0A3L8SDP2_CHLGU|nr:hypothetical protein DV515_00009343 [Chloebia gouldiae]
MISFPASASLPPSQQTQPSSKPWSQTPPMPLFVTALPCQIDQMFAAFPPDMSGNLDYKNLVHVITHGEEKD